MSNNSKILSILIITLFLDFVGLFMVVPIYAPLLLNPQQDFLNPDVQHFIRTFLIGALVAIYGVGQFFGGPLLGELSDQYGRKKILLLGLSVLVVANLLGAFGLYIANLSLLFICRFLTGVASGNAAVIFAAASSLSRNDKERGIFLGYLTGAASIGGIIGPMMGSHLSNPDFASWMSWYTPFLFMGLLFLVNILLVAFFYHDHETRERRSLDFTIVFKNIRECFKTPILRIMLIAYFLFVLSTESIFAGLPIFAFQEFNVSAIFLGNLFAFGSLIAAFSSFILNLILSRYFSSYWINTAALVILTSGYILLFAPSQAVGLYLPYGLIGLTCSLAWGHQNAIIASNVSHKVQGKVLGVTQSLLSLAIIFGPLTIGLVSGIHHDFIIYLCFISSSLSLLFFLTYWFYFSRKI